MMTQATNHTGSPNWDIRLIDRKLTDTETEQVRTIVDTVFVLHPPSHSLMEEDDRSDIAAYCAAMISNEKSIAYVMEEIAVFFTTTSTNQNQNNQNSNHNNEEISIQTILGNQLQQYVQSLLLVESLSTAAVAVAAVSNDDPNQKNHTNHHHDTTTMTTTAATTQHHTTAPSSSSTAPKNALIMSGALGATRERTTSTMNGTVMTRHTTTTSSSTNTKHNHNNNRHTKALDRLTSNGRGGRSDRGGGVGGRIPIDGRTTTTTTTTSSSGDRSGRGGGRSHVAVVIQRTDTSVRLERHHDPNHHPPGNHNSGRSGTSPMHRGGRHVWVDDTTTRDDQAIRQQHEGNQDGRGGSRGFIVPRNGEDHRGRSDGRNRGSRYSDGSGGGGEDDGRRRRHFGPRDQDGRHHGRGGGRYGDGRGRWNARAAPLSGQRRPRDSNNNNNDDDDDKEGYYDTPWNEGEQSVAVTTTTPSAGRGGGGGDGRMTHTFGRGSGGRASAGKGGRFQARGGRHEESPAGRGGPDPKRIRYSNSNTPVEPSQGYGVNSNGEGAYHEEVEEYTNHNNHEYYDEEYYEDGTDDYYYYENAGYDDGYHQHYPHTPYYAGGRGRFYRGGRGGYGRSGRTFVSPTGRYGAGRGYHAATMEETTTVGGGEATAVTGESALDDVTATVVAAHPSPLVAATYRGRGGGGNYTFVRGGRGRGGRFPSGGGGRGGFGGRADVKTLIALKTWVRTKPGDETTGDNANAGGGGNGGETNHENTTE